MRTLKFRVWDKKDNRLLTVATIRELVNMCLAARKLLKPHLIHIRDLIQSEEAIFEQYTGLLDKNSKEIYEGDIVKYHDKILYVSYFGSSFIMAYPNRTNVWVNCIPGDNSVEILGNIHENSELLGGEE